MRILVTGAAGYIGSVLCGQFLVRGHSVIAVDDFIYGNSQSLAHLCRFPDFKFIKMDVLGERYTDWTSFLNDNGIDTIVPLAAIVGAPACKEHAHAGWKLNKGHIVDLCDARDHVHPQRFVYLNTNSGYGTKSGQVECTEETPLEPISDYGKWKVSAEYKVRSSPNTVVLRLATVFGVSPRMRLDLLVNDFIHRIIKDGSLTIYEPDAKRNFVYVGDVAECICRMITDKTQHTGIYNFGNDDLNMSKRELVEHLRCFFDFEVFYGDKEIDPDKRDYIVSNKKINDIGIVATTSIQDAIPEFKNYFGMINRFKYGNV